jgi:hypothetical protein
MHNEETTLVVFRRWKDSDDIIALFPELPADYQGLYCDAFEHCGQHGGADYFGVIHATSPVTEEDASPLIEELKRIGYRLRPIKRASYRMHEARRAEAKRFAITSQRRTHEER